MNLEKVLEAQRIIANAKRELAIRVKRRLEHGGCFEASDVTYRIRKNRELKTLKINLHLSEWLVSVYLYEPEEEKSGWSYKFSCEKIGLNKIPPTGYKETTAKGNLIEVRYRDSRQKLVRENIILKEYYDSNEHVNY